MANSDVNPQETLVRVKRRVRELEEVGDDIVSTANLPRESKPEVMRVLFGGKATAPAVIEIAQIPKLLSSMIERAALLPVAADAYKPEERQINVYEREADGELIPLDIQATVQNASLARNGTIEVLILLKGDLDLQMGRVVSLSSGSSALASATITGERNVIAATLPPDILPYEVRQRIPRRVIKLPVDAVVNNFVLTVE